MDPSPTHAVILTLRPSNVASGNPAGTPTTTPFGTRIAAGAVIASRMCGDAQRFAARRKTL
jgi:hypothetical protein